MNEELRLLLFGFVGGCLISMGFFAFQFIVRRRKFNNLVPNCLLTRDPLMLITPPESLFSLTTKTSDIFRVLANHGYQIEWLKLPQPRLKECLEKFEKTSRVFHILIIPDYIEPLKELVSRHKFQCVKTVTPLDTNNPYEILNRAVELAEQDLTSSMSSDVLCV